MHIYNKNLDITRNYWNELNDNIYEKNFDQRIKIYTLILNVVDAAIRKDFW